MTLRSVTVVWKNIYNTSLKVMKTVKYSFGELKTLRKIYHAKSFNTQVRCTIASSSKMINRTSMLWSVFIDPLMIHPIELYWQVWMTSSQLTCWICNSLLGLFVFTPITSKFMSLKLVIKPKDSGCVTILVLRKKTWVNSSLIWGTKT